MSAKSKLTLQLANVGLVLFVALKAACLATCYAGAREEHPDRKFSVPAQMYETNSRG